MRLARRVITIVALALAVLPGTAFAKGASEATLTGRGLDTPIRLEGNGEPGAPARLARLGELSGIYAAMFGETRVPLQDKRPTEDLGPGFDLTYVVPGPSEEAELSQVVYPYAEGGPVTYTESGQSFFETERTEGGWFQASDGLKSLLVSEGLPRTRAQIAAADASHAGTSGVDQSWVLPTVIAMALVGAAALALRARAARPAMKRRSPAPRFVPGTPAGGEASLED